MLKTMAILEEPHEDRSVTALPSNDIVLHRDVTAVIIIIRGEETRIYAST
jgi:hypothetical protein